MKALLKASLVFAFLSVGAQIANAIIEVNFSITTTSVDPALGGLNGSGQLSYDETLLDGVGDASLESSDFLVSVTLFSQTFTNGDDFGFPSFPILTIEDSEPTFLNFIVGEAGGNPIAIADPRVLGVRFEDIVVTRGGEFTAEAIVIPVPEPTAASFLIVFSVLLACARRKRV